MTHFIDDGAWDTLFSKWENILHLIYLNKVILLHFVQLDFSAVMLDYFEHPIDFSLPQLFIQLQWKISWFYRFNCVILEPKWAYTCVFCVLIT